jgi:N-acetylneuraminic acid mutarotase
MAYDPGRDTVVLFGGGGALRDTWVLERRKNKWRESEPTGDIPPGRGSVPMVYEPVGGRMLLWAAGGPQTNFDVMWTYDQVANSWSRLEIQGSAPEARHNEAMTYDPATKRVILFGGYNGSIYLNDTWAFDPATNTWSQLHPSTPPPARGAHSMAYDSASGRIILFGGSVPREDDELYQNDTWAYDPVEDSWAELLPAGPLPRYRGHHTLIDAPGSAGVLLFGGYGWDRDGYTDIWEYDL